jgi:hypothetical protein
VPRACHEPGRLVAWKRNHASRTRRT